MISKILCTIFICLLFGCGGDIENSTITNNSDPTKSKESLESCNQISVPKDIGLNGKFLYHFVKCSSSITPSGKETLQGAINLVNVLEIDGLQLLADFITSNPGNETDTGYPIIRTLMAMLERGASDQNGIPDLELTAQRFGPLQKFAMDMDPYWISNLIIQMKQTGNLEKLIDKIIILDQLVNMNSIFALSRNYLTTPELAKALAKSTSNIFRNEALYESLKRILTIEKSEILSKEVQEQCLKNWLTPKIQGEKEFINTLPTTKWKSQTMISGPEKYQDFLNEIGESGVKKLRSFFAHIASAFVKLDSEERLGIMKRISQSFSKAFLEQEGPMRNLLALAHYFTGKENNHYITTVEDFDSVINGLQKILKETGPIALLSINQKIGSSKLHSMAEKILFMGGEIDGCPSLILPGLEDIVLAETPDRLFKALSRFLKPNELCRQNLSPLGSALFSTLEKNLNLPIKCDEMENIPNYCITEKELVSLGKKLNSPDWNELEKITPPDNNVLKALLVKSLEECKTKLKIDPLELHWARMARGPVKLEQIDYIIDQVERLTTFTPETVAELDAKIDATPETNQLKPDFLEKLLNQKIGDLSSTVEQFNDISLAENDLKTKRIFAGIYSHGPWEQFIKNEFYLEKLEQIPAESFPTDKYRIKEILARLRTSGAIFKNHRLDNDENKPAYKFLGEKKQSVKFNYIKIEKNKYKFEGFTFTKSPLLITEILGSNFWRLENILLNDLLVGKDVSYEGSDKFIDWIRNNLYPYLSEKDWNLQLNNQHLNFIKPIDLEFIRSTEYTAEEARQLALFYSIHNINAYGRPPTNENAHQIDQIITTSKPDIKRQFLSLPDDPGTKWTTYLEYFPEALKTENSITGITNQMLKEINDQMFSEIPWASLPFDKKGKRKLDKIFSGNSLETVKILSTLNLFTSNKKNKFMPLVGIGEQCHLKNGIMARCPITFVQTVDKSKMDGLRNYTHTTLKSQLCPLLAPTPGFSNDFHQRMQSLLNISANDNFYNFCSKNENLFDQVEKRVPEKFHQIILSDIFNMGKNPKLKRGLSTVGIQIRYYKLLKKYKGQSSFFIKNLINSPGGLPFELQPYAHKQISDSKGFMTSRPGLINMYLHYMGKETSRIKNHYENSLERFGAGVDAHQNLATGNFQNILENIIIKEHQQIQNRKSPILKYILNVITALHSKENSTSLKSLSNLFSHPYDLETFPSLTKALPLLLAHLAEDREDKLDLWKKPGPNILKHLLHQENLHAMNIISSYFSPDEIATTVSTLLEAIETLGGPDDALDLIEKLIDLLKNEFMAKNQNDETIIIIFEDAVRTIFKEKYIEHHQESFNLILDSMARKNMGFNKKPAPTFVSQLEGLFEFLIKQSHHLLTIYQDHFKSELSSNDEDYLKKLVLSITIPFENKKTAEGAKHLAFMLEDPRFGTWNNLFLPIISNPEHKHLMLNSFDALLKSKSEDWITFMHSSNEILPKIHNTLKYISQKTEFKDSTFKYSIDVLTRFGIPGNILLPYQTELINHWLTGRKETEIMQFE